MNSARFALILSVEIDEVFVEEDVAVTFDIIRCFDNSSTSLRNCCLEFDCIVIVTWCLVITSTSMIKKFNFNNKCSMKYVKSEHIKKILL